MYSQRLLPSTGNYSGRAAAAPVCRQGSFQRHHLVEPRLLGSPCTGQLLHRRATHALASTSAFPSAKLTIQPRSISGSACRVQRARPIRCIRQLGSGVDDEASGSTPADDQGQQVAANNGITYDEDSKTMRIPLSTSGQSGRRTKLVMFTCNKCGGRSSRNVNPLAWEKGLVFCQCEHCSVWHTLANNNKTMLEEIIYDKETSTDDTASEDGQNSAE